VGRKPVFVRFLRIAQKKACPKKEFTNLQYRERNGKERSFSLRVCAYVVRVLDCFRPSEPWDRIPGNRVPARLRSPAASRVASAADRLSSDPFPWNRNEKRRNHPQSIHALASFVSYPHMPGQGRTGPPRPVETRISSDWIMFGNSTSRVFAHLVLSSSVRLGAQLSSRCLYLF